MFSSAKNNNILSDSNPWKEDAQTAYQNFLSYAGEEANAGVDYNRQVLGLFSPSKQPQKLQVHAHNGDFYPLSSALSRPAYCSKVTIRNVENALFFFNFKDNILARILGIDAANPKVGEQFQIAYRNIVPSEFAQATQLAGPMGFHEYIIDGNNYKKNALISFYINSDFEATPIKIVLENCKGICNVNGLNTESIARIFENKCSEKDLIFDSTNAPSLKI